MKDFDFDTEYTGMAFRFDIKGMQNEFPDLAPFDGRYGTIDSIEIEVGGVFEDNYWNVVFDDGERLEGISGIHLILLDL